MSEPSQNHIAIVADQVDRLDRFLARLNPEISRARFQGLIAEGHVTVEEKIITDPGHRLKPGHAVSLTMPEAKPAEPVAENIPLTIIYEDKDLIVIDKPAGLVVHPGNGNEDGTLVNALLAHCGESLSGIGGVKRPGIVHRLDKDTSGLLVVAKNDKAHQGLSEQFAAHGRDGRLERAYVAFVWGQPERKAGIINANLGRSPANRLKIAVSRGEQSKEAITHYEVQEIYGKPALASLVRCVLETGRTHQIRVHMAHIGHPLLGDNTYGSGFKSSFSKLDEATLNAVNALKGQALHAATLGFEHPRTGKMLSFQSPLPEAMQALHSALKQSSTVPKLA
jgi:23S rRNA pseudouridine1911/1915/1917 synthase